MPRPLALLAFGCFSLLADLTAQTPLGPGPGWRGPRRPTAANEVFATGDGCAMCHSAASTAMALHNATGDDVSPHGLWQSTMMANSFRDPYWRATVQKEVAAAGVEVQALCIRCHAPMAHHTARLGGEPSPHVRDLYGDALAQDGVSCTVCHQIRPDGLGTEASFSGQPVIDKQREVFGPFADPAGQPMVMMSRYTPTGSPHVQQSKLCGSCHTLSTQHGQHAKFPEQTPYLEWRNSSFSDENGSTAESRTCQQCHMPDQGLLKIARNPMGRDFLVPNRPFMAHLFVGGNAFMLDLFDQNRDALGVAAPSAALQRTALATRRQLATSTVQMQIGEIARKDGKLQFSVQLTNLTGHKFPTGYPSRRAWLHVQVTAGRELLFETGAFDSDGRLVGLVGGEMEQPHHALVEKPSDVVIYELVAADPDGVPTTHLTRMALRMKDTRLLPRGWRRDGPDAATTSPQGTDTDIDFVAGGDSVAFAVPVAEDAGPVRVVAWLHFQTVPPAWADALRSVDADEARAFVQMYDAAEKLPETVAVGVRVEGN